MTRRLPRLTPEKRRLLSQLIKQRQEPGSESQSGIPTADRSKPLPLSFGQERLWFLDQMAPGNPFYNDCEAFRLRGPLDAEALERALNRIVDRHEILRTAFPTRDGRPRQQVTAELEVRLSSTDRWRLDYNHQRPHSSLDYLTPAEYSARCIASAAKLLSATPQAASPLQQHSGTLDLDSLVGSGS